MRLEAVYVGLAVVSCGCQKAGPTAAVAEKERVEESPLRTPAMHGPDFSTDLAVRQAFKAATGKVLADDACIARPPAFPPVVILGSFAHDVGCSTSGLFIDGVLQDRLDAGTWSKRVLATLDFARLDLPSRKGLGRFYVDQVAHAFGGRFVTEATPAFALSDTPEFAEVVTEDAGDGFVVKGWTFVPPGMVDERRFVFMIYAFTVDGQVTAQRGDEFSVPGDRLR